jgi:light-regulated signal transduction histidine kinase (bacteriophytochrome)
LWLLVSKDGTPLQVGIASQFTANGSLKISFKDNGVGFNIQYDKGILKPFQPLNGIGLYGDSGMGLTICDKIVSAPADISTGKEAPATIQHFISNCPNLYIGQRGVSFP